MHALLYRHRGNVCILKDNFLHALFLSHGLKYQGIHRILCSCYLPTFNINLRVIQLKISWSCTYNSRHTLYAIIYLRVCRHQEIHFNT